MLVPSGVVCLHDYGSVYAGVKYAADQFLARYPNYRLREIVDTLAIVEKLDWGEVENGPLAVAESVLRQRAWRLSKSLRRRLPIFAK